MNNNTKKWAGFILALLIVIGVGYGVFAPSSKPNTKHTDHMENAVMYTCSMHPQVKKTEPGRCPLCGMDLIPMDLVAMREDENKDRESDTGFQQVTLSEKAEKLAEVEVSPVIRDFATETLHLTGKLVVDETRLETISAWFPGRIEKLFINYAGLTVEPNTHMAMIYSPELMVAQKELLEAHRSQNAGLIHSSKEKLRLWGFGAEQIQAIIRTGKISDTLTLSAPIGGTVLTRYVKEGDYVKTGTKLYDVATLDRLWLIADVYESDASKLSYGQSLTFSTLAYPGKIFKGTVTFVDPIVNAKTRTIRVRAIVDNKTGELKPEMLAKVSVQIRYGEHGPIQEGDVADLWVSPMHPEEFSTKPGTCPVCGMRFKKASELGLVSTDSSSKKPLLIPASAPLITGKRAIVYVRVPGKTGVYEGRDIHLGPKVGDYYIVMHGLDESEGVVTKGNFKIDSAMQLQAKPSMMDPKGDRSASEHRH